MDFNELSDGAFLDLVNQDIRGKLDDQSSRLLRSVEYVDRWHDALVSILRTLHAQLASNQAEQTTLAAEFLLQGSKGRQAWMSSKADLLKKRKSIIRVKNGVEDRLAEAKRTRAQHRSKSHISTVISERNAALQELQRLRKGIMLHRSVVDGVEEPDGEADEALWALVDHEPSIG